MNSVIEIGDKISYVHKGKLWWEGNRESILESDNEQLNEFVFATELTRKLKRSI
jgi:phospholipid/cholesterol/gamma-HCH transport system ATP-binding protein